MTFIIKLLNGPSTKFFLGETVCARRRSMKIEDWELIGKELAYEGKEIIFSTQTLIESEADLKNINRIIEVVQKNNWLLEVNDQSALQCAIDADIPFISGPSLNIYNIRSLNILISLGLKQWCYPLELSRDTLVDFQSNLRKEKINIDTEVFAYGNLPLAWSSRCFTARFHDLPKDKCGFVCQSYPDGLMMRSQESQDVFVLNGIQTLSGARCNLLNQLSFMEEQGVKTVRLSPQAQNMGQVVTVFDKKRRGVVEKDQEIPLFAIQDCNGYWFGRPGMEYVLSESQPS
ncbi:MAG: U32 family peptidase [Nitrincola sp.]|nr:U32 family peptidase [Nitrincola sp.]